MKYQKKKYTEKLQHEEVNEEKEEVKKRKRIHIDEYKKD